MKVIFAFIITLCISEMHSQIYGQEVKINENLVIESDGTVRMDSSATVWNDIMVYPDATTRGGSNPPVWGTRFKSNEGNTSQGVFLWMFSSSQEQELYFTLQIPHNYKLGSDLFPHVHWTTVNVTPSGTNVVWGLEYTIVAIGGHFPVTNTITGNSVISFINTPTSAGQHLINSMGSISGTNIGISSIIICRIFRAVSNASDTFANEVGFLGFDVHYELDTQGSREEYIK